MASTYSAFVRSVLDSSDRNVGVFFPRTDDADVAKRAPDRLARKYSLGALTDDIPAAPLPSRSYHIFLAYFGGRDDDLALRLVLQLCAQSKTTATVVRVSEPAAAGNSGGGHHLFETAQASLPSKTATRVKFDTAPGSATAEDLLKRARPASRRPDTPGLEAATFVVVGRDSGAQLGTNRSDQQAPEELVACLGRVAGRFVAGGVRADLLVVQAKKGPDVSRE